MELNQTTGENVFSRDANRLLFFNMVYLHVKTHINASI